MTLIILVLDSSPTGPTEGRLWSVGYYSIPALFSSDSRTSGGQWSSQQVVEPSAAPWRPIIVDPSHLLPCVHSLQCFPQRLQLVISTKSVVDLPWLGPELHATLFPPTARLSHRIISVRITSRLAQLPLASLAIARAYGHESQSQQLPAFRCCMLACTACSEGILSLPSHTFGLCSGQRLKKSNVHN
jgi:hypothetical protein